VLERARVADEVKGLEQPARATLRKHGVRFGAYHIYLPLLLKPAPRALAAQLWALAHDGPQTKGLDDLLHLAAGGRTSFAVNREIDAALYRTAGYRMCGERAVRVDILERLADLIRPALAWREGAAAPKPPGAIAGGGFVVVNTMTSLIGASGEDFASILRSLGYRMERRPKPAEPAPAPVSVIESVSQEAAPETESTAAQSQETVEPAMASPATEEDVAERSEPDERAVPPRESEIDAPVAALAEPESAIPPVDFQEPESQAAEPLAEAATTVPDGSLETSPPAEMIAEPTKEGAEAAPSEPVLIEVWRPGRAEGRRRPPRPKRRGAGQREGSGAGTTTGGRCRDADRCDGGGRFYPTTRSRRARNRLSATAGRASLPPAPQRPAGSDDRPRRERERPPAHVRPERHERHERREKAADPNSPFAKLAALKAQLEAEAKERR